MNNGKPVCYICSSDKFVDGHHYDCCEGELSPETVPLCRRCHRTYHDLGVDWFEDEYLDKIIEIENKRRAIHNKPNTLPPITRNDVVRSDYWNKKHGIKGERNNNKGIQTPAFPFHLPQGEPLCGWQWVHDHMHDLLTWVPKIEIVSPNHQVTMDIKNRKELKEAVKVIRGLKQRK